MLYSTSLLFIHFIYSSVHLLIPYSQFIPSPFPFGDCKFSMSVSLFLFSQYVHLYSFKIPHISDIFFSLWLTSLSMIISRSTHVAANGIISVQSFLWPSSIPLYVCTSLYPCICLWTYRLLPCLGYYKIVPLWTLGCMYLFELELSPFPDIFPGVGLLNHKGNPIFSFGRNLCMVFHSSCANLHSHPQCLRGLLNTIFYVGKDPKCRIQKPMLPASLAARAQTRDGGIYQ